VGADKFVVLSIANVFEPLMSIDDDADACPSRGCDAELAASSSRRERVCRAFSRRVAKGSRKRSRRRSNELVPQGYPSFRSACGTRTVHPCRQRDEDGRVLSVAGTAERPDGPTHTGAERRAGTQGADT
jgi:hypothetical protein